MAAGAVSASLVALLIDADNLSPDGMEDAVAQLAQQGLRLSVARAYGSHETLGAIREFLQRHGVKAIVNQGKGTTDAALVVDAMDLLHAGCLPGTVVIGSGDADFAPLAVRLREAGIKVLCFAQRRKAAAAELERVYARVVYVDSPSPGPAPAPAPAQAAPARAPAARKTTAKRSAARKAAPPAPPPPPADPVRELLDSLPGFAEGQAVALNEVVKKLRDAGLIGRNASASAFFKKQALPVELMPARQPNKLRLRTD
jgi:hypothetical protein